MIRPNGWLSSVLKNQSCNVEGFGEIELNPALLLLEGGDLFLHDGMPVIYFSLCRCEMFAERKTSKLTLVRENT